MARAWFFLVLLNSSSFSATRLSISCFTCPSSSWARRTLFSSCSSLVQLSLALNSVLQVTAGIAQIKLHVGLVLLRLDLVSAQAVNLLTKISHGVVVLHAKSSKSSLMGNVQLLELALEATKLTLPLLVQLNLSSCVGASLLKTRCNILNPSSTWCGSSPPWSGCCAQQPAPHPAPQA